MLWDETKQLPKEAFKVVEQMYEQSGFFLDVRLHLAQFVESNFMSGTTNDIPVDDNTAATLASQLLSQLDAKIAATPNDPDKFLVKAKLQEMSDNLKQLHASNLVKLYTTVKSCLEQERQIVSQYSSGGSMDSGFANLGSRGEGGSSELASQIRQQIEVLKGKIHETSVELDRCKQEQEVFSGDYFLFRENKAKFDSMQQQLGSEQEVQKIKKQQDAMNKSIQAKYYSLTNQRSALMNAFKQIYDTCKKVQDIVLEQELIQWKRHQQLAGNGFTMNAGHLETIQEWCEGLADIIWNMKQQVKQLQALREKVSDPQNSNTEQDMLMNNITKLLTDLVTGTFIIEKQPPQVMKTNTRFTATVRLLVGGILNVHMAAPSVSVSIVSENQANQLLMSNSNTPKRREDFNSGDILNGTGTMEYHNATKQVSVSFRNLQLKKIKRTEKKGTESVMDEKFAVLFWTEFTVGDLKFQLWTLSLPVVVIVHGNQEPQALATVTWDNAFAEWGRRPFCVPDKVTWGQVSNALNMKWTQACGSPMTEENKYYLACKAFRNNNLPKNMEEINNLVLSWPLFCKEALPERNFTFWEWFHRILILTQTHMQKLWKEGFVMGFVSKQAAEGLLLGRPNGTFLLRFSDSELGGVTIAYVRQPDQYQSPIVFMVAPFTTRDLSQRSMADVIFDLPDLTYLFPETPKEAFRQFCSSNTGAGAPTANGYVRHTLVTQVEGFSAGYDTKIGLSAPTTPMAAGGLQYQSEIQQPWQMDMDMSDMPSVDINTGIDVLSILGITEDGSTFMQPQDPQGNS